MNVHSLGPERYSHFVLFRVDPLASVANLGDDDASKAAALLSNDSYYLGIVMTTAADRYWADGRPELNFKIYLVGQGPSSTPGACVPIFPAPQLAEDHPPIQLPTALPWPNLYVRSYDTITAAITCIHDSPNSFPGSLSKPQREELQRLVSVDYFRLLTSQNEAQAGRKPATPRSSVSAGSRSDHSGSSEDSSSQGVLASEDERSIYGKDDHFFLHGEIYVDLSACPRPPDDPSTCSDCVAELERIRSQWLHSAIGAAKEKRPQMTSEWIRGVQAAGSQRPDDSAGEPVDDDLILPEDAVDERLAKDNAARLKQKVADVLCGRPKRQPPGVVIMPPFRLSAVNSSEGALPRIAPSAPLARADAASPAAAPEPPAPDSAPPALSNEEPHGLREDSSKPSGNRLRAIARAGITSLRSAFIRVTRITGHPRATSRDAR
ncbi:hypothetical protein AURDEDRAFT_175443 [Auricularia subglabra TFB-10046 SS5]|uniref:Uncharacterized protein n=1 Tax=Auricularia subglabra (strain TFB-10046 / SS5) TaxID=717982 RepID=J0CXM0_AURST|nr:hypothetical protein AURDEDRAFT_175443 [Auricularia subglabra TFB-10046 SS5]